MKDRETISSPTVSTEALMKIIVIDTTEKWDVVILNASGTYFHAGIMD